VATLLGGAGCSTCAAAAQRKPPLEPLPRQCDASERQGLGRSRCCRAACSRSRPSCGFAAVGSATPEEPAAGGLLGRPAAGNLAAARAFLALALGPLQPGPGGHRSGRGGVAANRLASGSTGDSPCASAPPRVSGRRSRAGWPAPAAVIRRAAVALTSQADGALFACRGSARPPPPIC